jgi:hypothetical protein
MIVIPAKKVISQQSAIGQREERDQPMNTAPMA